MDDWSRAIQEGPTPVPWATVGSLAVLLWGAFVLLFHVTFGVLRCDPATSENVSCSHSDFVHSTGYVAGLVLTLAGVALLLIALVLRRAPSAWLPRTAGLIITAVSTLFVAVFWLQSS